MNNIRNTTEKLTNWLNKGTSPVIMIKKILVISVALLMLYYLGYAIGKLFSHLGF